MDVEMKALDAADEIEDENIDPHFARSLLAFTAQRSETTKKLPALDQGLDVDLEGFLSRRVVLGGFPAYRDALNGAEGVVTGQHHIAKTYAVTLEKSGRVIHAPAANLFLAFDVDNAVDEVGGAFDNDGHSGGATPPQYPNKSKKGLSLGERHDGEENVRLDNCHDFAWSGMLWAEEAKYTAKLSVGLFAVWIILGWGLLGENEGLGVLDSFYLLAATITTVGIGDYYPATESGFISAIFLIPMGLVVLSMLWAFAASRALSKLTPLKEERASPNDRTALQWMRETIAGKAFVLVVKFLAVIMLGAFVFYGLDDDQQKDHYTGTTFTDAMFFAVVIATSVGYGHELWPLSSSGKGFLIFYFFFATFTVGGILGEVVDLYLNGVLGEQVKKTIIGSTIWVHRADIDGDGKISEADYVLFKLQQMQKLDSMVLDQLIDKFHLLDESGEGALDIGIEVPSATDVVEMKRIKEVTGSDKPLMDMWGDLQAKRLKHKKNKGVRRPELSTRVNACHDFAWSRELWREAANRSSKVSRVLLVVYLALAFGLLGGIEGWRFLDSLYFIVATMTTVGFGDFAPTMQITRGFSIILIPLGLVTLSFFASTFLAFGNVATPGHLATRRKINTTKHGGVTQLQAVYRGQMARKENRDIVCKINKTKIEATEDKKSNIARTKFNAFADSIPGRIFFLVCQLICISLGGALFFKLYAPEAKGLEKSWWAAFYLATEISSTVGYGDHTMQTDSGKIFMIFFMLVATLVDAQVWAGLIDLYVNGVLGERVNNKIIHSTIWVHRADIDGDGKITEADYVLFKLRQMQKVDRQTMHDLTIRFRRLDESGEGLLDVGVEVPSAVHVSEMQRHQRKIGGAKTLVEIWEEVQAKVRDESEELDDSLKWVFQDARKRTQEVMAKKNWRTQMMVHVDRASADEKTPATKVQVRLNKCHSFDWSRKLWGEVSAKVAKVSALGVGIYAVLGYFFLGYNSGLRGLDCWYLIAATVTTVGIGDLYPSEQGTRAAAICLLPAGLVLVGMGITFVVSYALAQTPVLASDVRKLKEEQDRKEKTDVEAAESARGEGGTVAVKANAALAWWRVRRGAAVAKEWLASTVPGRLCAVLLKFAFTVLLGALVFYGDEGEYFWDSAKQQRGESFGQEFQGRTFVDSLFFAVVVSTSIGYGHRLWPLTAAAKGFLVFYFFFSTIVVGGLVQEVVDLLVNACVGERIVSKLIDSTTYVHKADTDGDGKISEADYVLFKLQQLLKIDADVHATLVDRYLKLDTSHDGFLNVGVEIPSAAQVKEMQQIVTMLTSGSHKNSLGQSSNGNGHSAHGAGLSEAEMWGGVQARLAYDELHGQPGPDDPSGKGGGGIRPSSPPPPFLHPCMLGIYKQVSAKTAKLKREGRSKSLLQKTSTSFLRPGSSAGMSLGEAAKALKAKMRRTHDFKWSRKLWQDAAQEIARYSLSMFAVYIAVAYFALCWPEGWRGVDPFYFLAATITTVGFGDFAPTRQDTRAAAVLLLPAGLAVFSSVVAFVAAHGNARSPSSMKRRQQMEKEWAVTSMQSAFRGHAVRTKEKHTATTTLARAAKAPLFSKPAPLAGFSSGGGGGDGGDDGALLLAVRSNGGGDNGDDELAMDDDELEGFGALSSFELTGVSGGGRGSGGGSKGSPLPTESSQPLRGSTTQRSLSVGLSFSAEATLKAERKEKFQAERKVLRAKSKAFKAKEKVKEQQQKKKTEAAKKQKSDDQKSSAKEAEEETEGATIAGKLPFLFFKFFVVVLIGAVILKACSREDEALTWTDAFYFAVTTSTTVGYGDVTPSTRSGKALTALYCLASTVVVADVLNELVHCYVNEVEGERINALLLDSTVWVHKADTNQDGEVSEAEYLLFKLQQMQRVDTGMLDRLIDRYHDLDRDGSQTITVGVEVPSKRQVFALEVYQRELRVMAKTKNAEDTYEYGGGGDDDVERNGAAKGGHSLAAPAERTLAELWQCVREKLSDDSLELELGLRGVWRDAKEKMAKAAEEDKEKEQGTNGDDVKGQEVGAEPRHQDDHEEEEGGGSDGHGYLNRTVVLCGMATTDLNGSTGKVIAVLASRRGPTYTVQLDGSSNSNPPPLPPAPLKTLRKVKHANLRLLGGEGDKSSRQQPPPPTLSGRRLQDEEQESKKRQQQQQRFSSPPPPHSARSSMRSSVSSMASDASDDVQGSHHLRDERLAGHYEGGGTSFDGPTVQGEVGGGHSAESYTEAANGGNAAAQNILGAMCATGANGCPQSDEKAAHWFRVSADSGNAQGQTNLGECYARGMGVPLDGDKAERLFLLAAAQGHEPAKAQLKALRSQGRVAGVGKVAAIGKKAGGEGRGGGCESGEGRRSNNAPPPRRNGRAARKPKALGGDFV